MPSSARLSSLVAITLVVGIPATALAVDYRFVRIADTRDGPYALDPGRHVAINNAGTVAFWRQQTLGGGPTGIFLANGGALTPIATDAMPALAGLGVLEPSINDSGQVAFYADGAGGSRIFRADPDGTITLLAQTGAGTFSGLQQKPSINNAAIVAFHSGSRAYINAGAGNVETYGPTVPATGVAVATDPFLNNMGELSLAGSYGLAVGGLAHLRGAGGPPTIIADGSSTITSYINNSVNDFGLVVFGATTTSGQVIFTGLGGGLTNIADDSGPYAAIALDAYSGFGAGGDPAINNSGVVAFTARLDTGPFGIFTGADPDTTRVVQTGSILFGRTMTSIFGGLSREAINNAGEIAFQAQVLDGNGFSDIVVKAVPSVPMKWDEDADGTWSDSGNWLGPVPSTFHHDANFTDAITAPRTVTVDGAFTVGSINFNNVHKYTITGPGSITLNDSFGGKMEVFSGNHDIDVPLLIAGPSQAIVTGGSELTLRGGVTGAGSTSMQKSGGGILTVLNWRLPRVLISSGTGKVLPNGTSAATSRVQNLDIAGAPDAWTAKLDLTNNDLVIDYQPFFSPIATVANQISTAYAAGAWSGNGITTSTGDASSFALGYAEASDLFTTFPAVFSGQSIDADTLLISFTRYGDADLSGTVNLDDFNRLATNFGSAGKVWSQGNFNYDPSGNVDLDDFNLLAGNFGLSAGPDGVVDPEDWAALASAIPEPSLLLPGVPALAGMCLRRRTRIPDAAATCHG